MESHSRRRRSNAGATEAEDRLSGLPDDLLHSILRSLPLKQAVRTSALSRRWVPQWLRALAASPVLDLTDRDFARRQPLERATATVARCLRLHAEHGAPLHAFRVALEAYPSGLLGSGGGALGRDVVGWVTAAVARGARELGVDLMEPRTQDEDSSSSDDRVELLELPGDVFQVRNSLQRLALGGVSLRAVPLPAAGLAGLRSLSLSHADITDEAVEGVLANCGALESLTLTSCHLLTSVSIASERLGALELVDCRAVRDLRVAAPALESFAFHGHAYDTDLFHGGPVEFDLGDMPALRDAYLSHLGYDFDVNHDGAYPYLYHAVGNARTLTICSVGLLLLEEDWKSCQHPDLEELQLLMACPERGMILKHLYTLFTVTRQSRRLFVRIMYSADIWYGQALGSVEDEEDSDAYEGEEDGGAYKYEDEEDGGAYEHEEDVGDASKLTLIKVVNFRGTRRVLWLLKFLLKRAPVLEQLVLVTPEGEGASGDEQLEAIRKRVSRLQMASREARISVCRPSEDESPSHAHTRFFHEEY